MLPNALTNNMEVFEYWLFFTLIAFGLITYILSIINPRQESAPVRKEIRYLNKCESPIETRLYKALCFNGYSPVTQQQVGPYRIDIALPSYRLAIECDGKAYHSSPSQKAHDRRKDAYLRKNGWRVMRVSGRQIYSNIGSVVSRIDKRVKSS